MKILRNDRVRLIKKMFSRGSRFWNDNLYSLIDHDLMVHKISSTKDTDGEHITVVDVGKSDKYKIGEAIYSVPIKWVRIADVTKRGQNLFRLFEDKKSRKKNTNKNN